MSCIFVFSKTLITDGKTTLAQLQRSQKLGVIRFEDIASAIDTIELGIDRPQVTDVKRMLENSTMMVVAGVVYSLCLGNCCSTSIDVASFYHR